MKLYCKNRDSIPTTKDIITMTQDERLVLKFPKDAMSYDEVDSLIGKIKTTLPEEYLVYLSIGSDNLLSINILIVISKKTISHHIESIVMAINDYLILNNELLHNPDLYKDWELFEEHGEHNFYINKNTEQHLEACTFPITKLEQLDAFFLNIFVDTSKQYSELKKVIQPSYHEWSRILDYIKDNYVLTDEHQILSSSS